jgi:parvulin-like peptidyl-prolyl isomerase
MVILQRSTIPETDLLSRLASYQMLSQFQRESFIDQAIASIQCTETEIAKACQQFYQQNQLPDEAIRQAWLNQQQMSLELLEAQVISRLLKIEKFKHQRWNHLLESYFLKRKSDLDRVIYSLIQVQDAGIAEELYYRIQEHEQSFAELARDYSQGPEAQVNGAIGPVEMGQTHPALAHLLRISQPGQLWFPYPIGGWVLIVRLEQLIPAQLNAAMRQRLLNELFETWIQEQMQSSDD